MISALLVACTAGDDVVDGTRGRCAFGGALTDCPDALRSAEGACWRLVDCGAIAVHHETDDNNFDWDNCMNYLETLTADRERFTVACIATAVCDELRVPGSPDDPDLRRMQCFHFGDE